MSQTDKHECAHHRRTDVVLACGDVSLVSSVKLGKRAIAAGRDALKAGCPVVRDISTVTAALDQTRLAHLGCSVKTLIANSHIIGAAEAEQEFWRHQGWRDSPMGRQSQRLQHIVNGSVLVIGYAPSVLLAVCEAIANQTLQPALVIGMPIGFSYAPAAKRNLMQSNVPFITVGGALGGGLLAAVAVNAIAASLIEKPACHCHLDGASAIALQRCRKDSKTC